MWMYQRACLNKYVTAVMVTASSCSLRTGMLWMCDCSAPWISTCQKCSHLQLGSRLREVVEYLLSCCQ